MTAKFPLRLVPIPVDIDVSIDYIVLFKFCTNENALDFSQSGLYAET
jgi:hypothetical protein